MSLSASSGVGRSPALWAMVGLIAVSAVWLAFRLFGPQAAPTTKTVVALLIWSLYTAALTAIVVKSARDVQPPMKAAVLAGLWGALPAAAFAAVVASATRDRIADALGPSGQSWTSALAAPLPEEVAKAAGVALVMLAAKPALRNPPSGIALGAVVGVGFNAAEGLAFSVNEMARSGSWDPLWSDLLVRGFLTGLVTHAGLSAIVGAGIGYLFGSVDVTMARRVTVVAALLFAAVLLHTLIDTPLLDHWGVGGIIVKQLPVAVVFWGARSRALSEYWRRKRVRTSGAIQI